MSSENSKLLFFPTVLLLLFVSSAEAIDRGARASRELAEEIELFDCQTGESLGMQDPVSILLDGDSCVAPACSKHMFWDVEYCDGACSSGKTCQPTYRNENDPSQGIERCSCKRGVL